MHLYKKIEWLCSLNYRLLSLKSTSKKFDSPDRLFAKKFLCLEYFYYHVHLSICKSKNVMGITETLRSNRPVGKCFHTMRQKDGSKVKWTTNLWGSCRLWNSVGSTRLSCSITITANADAGGGLIPAGCAGMCITRMRKQTKQLS